MKKRYAFAKGLYFALQSVTIGGLFILICCSRSMDYLPLVPQISSTNNLLSSTQTPTRISTRSLTLTPVVTETATVTLMLTDTPNVSPLVFVLSQMGGSTNLTNDGFFVCTQSELDLSKLPYNYTIRIYC